MKSGLTFNQLASALIGISCIVFIVLIYFKPSGLDTPNKGLIIGFLMGQGGYCVHFIVGSSAGSQAKDFASAQNISNVKTQLEKVAADTDANISGLGMDEKKV